VNLEINAITINALASPLSVRMGARKLLSNQAPLKGGITKA